MDSFKSAAAKVLLEAGEPLHYKVITRIALELGLVETHGATPAESMNAQLSVDLKRLGESSAFVRTAPGTFALNSARVISPPLQGVTDEEPEAEAKEAVESAYVGSAGEYRVCSELLFRGWDASIMTVDTGMDIVATKDGRLVAVQVKTANLNDYGTYVFDVRRVSFERHSASNAYYVFVLHGDADRFLILPYHEMERQVHDMSIREVNHGERYRVTIKFRNGKVSLGKNGNEMDYFLEKWSLVK